MTTTGMDGRTRAMVGQLGLRVQELTEAAERADRLAEALYHFGSVDGCWGAHNATQTILRGLSELRRATVRLRDEMGMDTTWDWED